TFTWLGTFLGVILPGGVAGALIGWAEHLRRKGGRRGWSRRCLQLEATNRVSGRLFCMGGDASKVARTSGAEANDLAPVAPADVGMDRAAEVAALYRAYAVGLIRLAVVMLGDRPSAEDVVQDAFFGLYRRWDQLSDTGNALRYARS